MMRKLTLRMIALALLGCFAVTVMNFVVTANTSAAIVVGGNSFSTTQTGACSYSLSDYSLKKNSGGESHYVNVITGTGCTWTAKSNVTWMEVFSGSSGNGNGTINVTIFANDGPERVGTLTIAGKIYTVTQESGCYVSFSDASTTLAAGEATGIVRITLSDRVCAWAAVSDQPWLILTGGTSGTGNGTISFRTTANSGPMRSANIRAGQWGHRVIQSGCIVNLGATTADVSAAGGANSLSVSTNAGCAWTATSNQSWVTISNSNSGTGNGTVNYVVAANTGNAARTAVISVNEASFTLTQSISCVPAVTMSTQTVSAFAFTLFATVKATADCPWTATSNQSWATIDYGASGKGNGSVTIKVAANTGASQRQATLNIAGRTFTITQPFFTCKVVSLSSSSLRASAAAGSTAVDVTTEPAGCIFSVSPDSEFFRWVSVSGLGTSRITINFLENNQFERVSKIAFNNQTFTLTQAAKPVNCAGAFFAPTTQSAAYPGGTYQVDVSTGMDCRWEAVTATPWITLEAGTTRGIRRGTLIYRVATNPTAQGRSGTIQVNGQSFTVTQAGATACTSSVTPASANVAASGGTTTFNVSGGAGCNWSAYSSEMAAKVMTGGTGTGNGTVTVVTQPNTATTARTIKLMIAGQTVTLTQAGGSTSNPVPLLMRLAAKERTNPYKLSVFGTNFVSNSVVRWNGADRATTFVSNTELEITITQAEYYAYTPVQINVFNPAVGGGLSNTVNFLNPGQVLGVSAAGYNMVEGVTANSIAAIFGNEFTASTVVGRTVPLANTLGGVTVLLYDRDGRRYQLPLFFASPHQLNVLIPASLANGLAEMVITCSDGTTRNGYMIVQSVSPGLFSFNANGIGVVAGQALRVRNGVQTYENLASYNTTSSQYETLPIELGPETDKVFLVLYGTGLRGRTALSKVAVYAGGPEDLGIPLTPLYVGTQGSFLGLDQMNLEIPRTLIGKGKQSLWLNIDGLWGNVVEVNIK